MKDSFSIYRNTLEALESLPPDIAVKIVSYIGHYAMDDELPDSDNMIAYSFFCQIKPLIDKSKKKTEAGRTGGKANVKQTEANGKQTEANMKQTEANGKQIEAVNKKVESRNIKEIVPKGTTKKKFQPPSIDEVREYISQQGYSIDAEKFVDYYESKGWVVGKSPMKDWKAAVRNWSRTQRQEVTAKANGFDLMTPRNFDWDAFGRAVDMRVME